MTLAPLTSLGLVHRNQSTRRDGPTSLCNQVKHLTKYPIPACTTARPARNFHHGSGPSGALLLLPHTLLQPMRLLELFRQRPRRKILPDMRQPLLHLKQRILQLLLITDRNLPPPRIRTRRNPCHLLQRPSARRQ